MKLESGRIRTRVWVWYLITGALLAVARVALLKWVNRGVWTQTDYFVARWLYPEGIASLFWNSLVSSYEGTAYYLAWGFLITIGSFILATPILVVSWLRQRRTAARQRIQ